MPLFATSAMQEQPSKPRANLARGFLLRRWLAAATHRTGEESLTRRTRGAGGEQGGHPVGAANVLALHPGFGLFHQAAPFATTNLFPQSAARGGGVEA